MRPIVFSYPTETANEVCATQTTTATDQALILNGTLANRTQYLQYGAVPRAVFPGIQRTVQISSTGNISTSTFTITGRDIRGVAFTTTLAGPTGTVIPTHTTQEFNQVTAISVGTLASVSFTVGVGATGSSNPVEMNTFGNPFNAAITVVTGTSQPITIQDTQDNANDTSVTPTWFNHATLVTVTVNQESNYAFPVRYIRAIFTATAVAAATSSATTAGQVTVVQAG